MYWEDVYEMYEYAANLNSLERSEDMRFQLSLHANKKTMDNWKDLPLPFPDPRFVLIEKDEKEVKYSKIDSKVNHLTKREKASPEQLKRMEIVKEKLKEHKKKVRANLKRNYYRKIT